MFFNSFIFAKRSTKDSRLLNFNFKLINRILNNNYNLHKWDIEEDPLCRLCQANERDDTYHAFLECDFTCNKINEILNNLDPNRSWGGLIDTKKWLFGVSNPAINSILLLMKHYIHQVRGGKIFSLNLFRQELYLMILTDKKYKTEQAFMNKWGELDNLITDSENFGSLLT